MKLQNDFRTYRLLFSKKKFCVWDVQESIFQDYMIIKGGEVYYRQKDITRFGELREIDRDTFYRANSLMTQYRVTDYDGHNAVEDEKEEYWTECDRIAVEILRTIKGNN